MLPVSPFQSWEVSDSSACDINDAVEEHRSAVQTKMDEYMSSQYGASADAKAACAVYGTADGNLVVCCTGVATNLRNWWSGSWKGEYKITLAIQMANQGKSISEISEATNLSTEEVEPIIKYHGKN